MPTTESRPLHVIANEIVNTWGSAHVYFGAKPYLRAMQSLDKVTDKYFDDSAKDIVIYFLSNAKTWRGDDARRIKAELKALVK